jgi:mannose-6-phosphate isomerase-like protein (cupin superfamily)
VTSELAGRGDSEVAYDPAIGSGPIVIPPGEGHVLGNVEFLARTADTPRFNLAIMEIVPGRELEAHVHETEDDAFYILEGELTFFGDGEEERAGAGAFVLAPSGVEHGFRNETDAAVRTLNIHAPAGFDRRIGLTD